MTPGRRQPGLGKESLIGEGREPQSSGCLAPSGADSICLFSLSPLSLYQATVLPTCLPLLLCKAPLGSAELAGGALCMTQ